MHKDEKGRMAPAQSRVARSMRGNGNHKEKKVAKIEKVRAAQPKHTEEGWKDVEKSGGYRKALARGLKKTDKARQKARAENKSKGKNWMSGYGVWGGK